MESSTFNKKKQVCSLYFLILFLVSNFSLIVSSESVEEARALLKWKTSLPQKQNFSLLSSWNVYPVNATNVSSYSKTKISSCSWFGIDCNHAGRVISIYLRSIGLKGTLHEFSFSSFPHLAHLDLSSNQFFGIIPPQIGNLTKLTYIDLSYNHFSGKIPQEITLLTLLKDIYLSANQLHGTIPQELENLSRLEYLEIYSNNLFGSIPTEIGNLKSLFDLDMSKNQFSGHIPPSIGRIPRSLRNCRSLFRAHFERNHLTGNISEDLGIYPNLTFLDLSNNNFYGEISSNWEKCHKLGTLNISKNNLTGNLPPEIGNFSSLHELDLSSNHIVGMILAELGKLTNLNKLLLNENQLFGSIPQELGSLAELEYLDLSANRLSDSIPESLGYLTKLYYLNLSNNQLSKEIPIEIEKFVHLSALDLNHNFLKCPIPNSTAFRDAPLEALQRNKGLCGNVKGLPSCKAFTSNKQPLRKIWLVIVLLGAFCASIVVITVFIFFRQKKRNMQKQQSNRVNTSGLLSLLTFEGNTLYEAIICATNNFDIEYCIGEGAQGSVYKVELPYGDIIAVKKFHSPFPTEIANQQDFLNEIKALTELQHRNIVKFYGFCSHSRHYFLIYEYLERDSLAAALSSEAVAKCFGWRIRMNVIKGVACALSYMHHDCYSPIVHRDISSKNVLLDLEYEAHVSDFGVAKFLKPNSSNWTELVGTYGYVAPDY
ncbi:putative Receptor protein kinase [Melia azedarach]|uniref:Receptor protein kinase n=1 Tax=Melia azedarach TaxID=155640 RepID=A0ACC1YLG1_MELAZ|nr:putative Receptor protein kinase [Melia azedarach]